MKYQKIMIVGSAGSGKSYLAKQLAKLSGYPITHLDNEFWKPGWIKTPKEEWIAKQQYLISSKQWIIDGNYNSTLELRFTACDAVIFLDINRFVCMYGAIKRHGKKRSDLPEYLTESFDHEFLDFLKWIWYFPKTDKLKILALHKLNPNKAFIIIKSHREVARLLKELQEDT